MDSMEPGTLVERLRDYDRRCAARMAGALMVEAAAHIEATDKALREAREIIARGLRPDNTPQALLFLRSDAQEFLTMTDTLLGDGK